MKKLYIFTGKNKDPDGKYRDLLTEQALKNGGAIADSPAEADAIAVLGGDGTVMRAARVAEEHNLPIIGINLGRIGYMAEIEKDEIPLISLFFSGNYTEDTRMTLSVTVGQNEYTALNDAVIHAKSTHMTDLTLYCNGDKVNSLRGDGLIFASPTGSTAYSMSAGGPVIDPSLDCICVTPVCPQSLSVRPMIFSDKSVLGVVANNSDCTITVDGGEPEALNVGDAITIRKSDRPLRMIKLKRDGFYGILRKKMSE